MSKLKKALFGFLVGLILVLVLWDVWLIHFHTPGWEPAFTSKSPDGCFTVSVYSNVGVIRLPPGLNPRGRAGTVVLRDNRTGKVLQRAATEQGIGMEADISWIPEYNRVSITAVGRWDLPTE